jgi:hypothetical protein
MTTTTTGHELTIDVERGWVRIAGDLDTMQDISDADIHAACAAEGMRYTGEVIDEVTLRCVPVST